MRQSAILFQAKGLNFEGAVATPDDATGPVPGVAICHPHPLFGGSMDNNVVLAVASALVQQGFATVRFNVRGVGNSQGEHSKGELEHQEVLGALELLKAWPGVNGRKAGLVGYSFGASVILGSAALQKKARAFALIAPPLRSLESTSLETNRRPKLVIAGDRDKLAQPAQIQPVLETFTYPPTCQIVPGADHAWLGMESQLAQQVGQFFAEHLM